MYTFYSMYVYTEIHFSFFEMLHKRQSLLVAIEGIYSRYHHGNEVINQPPL